MESAQHVELEESKNETKYNVIETMDNLSKDAPTTGAMLHSLDDASSLLDTLLLLTAFILSFSIQLTVGTFSHDDLIEGDIRNLRVRAERPGELGSFSSHFLYYGMLANTYLVISLFLGVALNLSLNLSNAREKPSAFNAWFKTCRWIILLAYLFLAIGLAQFFRLSHLAVEMIFPRYDIETNNWTVSVMTSHFFNSTTNKMTEFASRGGARTSLLGVNHDISRVFYDTFTYVIPLMFVWVGAVSVYLHKRSSSCRGHLHTESNVDSGELKTSDSKLADFLGGLNMSEHCGILLQAGITLALLQQHASKTELLNMILREVETLSAGHRLALIGALQDPTHSNKTTEKPPEQLK